MGKCMFHKLCTLLGLFPFKLSSLQRFLGVLIFILGVSYRHLLLSVDRVLEIRVVGWSSWHKLREISLLALWTVQTSTSCSVVTGTPKHRGTMFSPYSTTLHGDPSAPWESVKKLFSQGITEDNPTKQS